MTQRYFPFFPGQGGGQGFGPPGGGQGFGPPGSPPGGPGGKGPGGKGPGGKGGPPSGGGGGTAPTSPPPGFTPSQSQAYSLHGGGGGGAGGQFGAYAVAPITLRYCLFRYVYIWPTWGPGFWAWLIFVGRGTAAGFRWTGRRWVYFGMDTRQISSFYCY